jgi:hypothetical protein
MFNTISDSGGGVEEIQASIRLLELTDGPVRFSKKEGSTVLAVEGHVVLLDNSFQAQNILDALGVKPHSAVTSQVSDHVCGALPGVAPYVHTSIGAADVPEEFRVTEQVTGGLIVL